MGVYFSEYVSSTWEALQPMMDCEFSHEVKESVRDTLVSLVSCLPDEESTNQYYKRTYPHFIQSSARALKGNEMIEL